MVDSTSRTRTKSTKAKRVTKIQPLKGRSKRLLGIYVWGFFLRKGKGEKQTKNPITSYSQRPPKSTYLQHYTLLTRHIFAQKLIKSLVHVYQ